MKGDYQKFRVKSGLEEQEKDSLGIYHVTSRMVELGGQVKEFISQDKDGQTWKINGYLPGITWAKEWLEPILELEAEEL